MSLVKLAAFAAAALALLAASASPVYAQALSTQNVTFVNNSTVFQSSLFDVCARAHIGSCPVLLTAVERFKGRATAAFPPSVQSLSDGQSVPISVNMTQAPSSVIMDFIFSTGSYNYTYQYPLQSYTSLGTTTVENVTLPVTNVISFVLPINASSIPVTLFATIKVVSTMSGRLHGGGFSGGANMTWSSPGTRSMTVAFSGINYSEPLYLSTSQVQAWSIGLYMGVPIIGPIEVYGMNEKPYTTAGTTVPAAVWYYVRIAKAVNGTMSPSPGAVWYEGGHQIRLSADPNIGFTFAGFFSGNSMISNSSQYSYTVDGPVNITAKFAPEPNHDIIASLFKSGGLLGSAGSIVVLMVLFLVILAIIAWFLRAH